MSANTVMTPAEVQKAAADKNNKIRAVEIQLREKVANWFTKSKPATYNRINDELIAHVVANKEAKPEQIKFAVHSAEYETKFLHKQPFNTMNYWVASDVIMDESQKQCNLIGEFVKAQGHNLVDVSASNHADFGIVDIKCEFRLAPSTTITVKAPNTDTPKTPTSGMCPLMCAGKIGI